MPLRHHSRAATLQSQMPVPELGKDKAIPAQCPAKTPLPAVAPGFSSQDGAYTRIQVPGPLVGMYNQSHKIFSGRFEESLDKRCEGATGGQSLAGSHLLTWCWEKAMEQLISCSSAHSCTSVAIF